MLSDKEVDHLLSTQIAGGSAARDWFLPHELPKGLENVRGVVRAIIAAYQDKLLVGVEIPRPDTHCWDDDTQQDCWSHSKDQLQQYTAACAAQAREKAIEQCLIKVTGLSVDVERCKQLQLTTQAWEEALDDAAAAIQKLKGGAR